MHLSQPVRDARIKQDALCRSRLPGINVRHDADVSTAIQRYGASHDFNSLRDIFPRG
jgi:hypothetical protein